METKTNEISINEFNKVTKVNAEKLMEEVGSKNESELTPITIECADCGTHFTWDSGEQKFYIDKKLLPPRRCMKCRLERRQRIDGNISITTGDEKDTSK